MGALEIRTRPRRIDDDCHCGQHKLQLASFGVWLSCSRLRLPHKPAAGATPNMSMYVHVLLARPSPPASRRVNLGGVGATIDPSAAATTHKCEFGRSYPPPLRPQRRLEGGDHSNPKRGAAFHCLDGLCPCRHALHPIEIS